MWDRIISADSLILSEYYDFLHELKCFSSLMSLYVDAIAATMC